MDSPESRTALALARHVSATLRTELLQWAEQMAVLSRSSASPWLKARKAVWLTHRSGIALAVTGHCAKTLHAIVWQDRSWAARLGISAVGIGTLAGSSQAAGIAAMGGAIGVPLWIVLGAGGTFIGTLIDELKKLTDAKSEAGIPEAEWEFEEDEHLELVPLDPPPRSALRAVVRRLRSLRDSGRSPESGF